MTSCEYDCVTKYTMLTIATALLIKHSIVNPSLLSSENKLLLILYSENDSLILHYYEALLYLNIRTYLQLT